MVETQGQGPVQERQPRRRRGAPRGPRGVVSLAQRARELGITVASLRRYVNLGSVQGQVRRVGNRIYVAKDLTPTPQRRRGALAVAAETRQQTYGRQGAVTRATDETRVAVQVNLDGSGKGAIQTGDAMLDHFLAQIARHGLLDLTVNARGDKLPDGHHLVEDVAIALGRALRQAVGEGRGIRRFGSALVPLDEALAQVAVDVGGRGYAAVETKLEGARLGSLAGEMVAHFLERLALEAGVSLHARTLAGAEPHHKAEALFKALGRALREAVEVDPRLGGHIPSTKGTVSG